MASRKLKVERTNIIEQDGKTVLEIHFSRKLTALEVSGVKAVLDGELK